MPKPVIDDKKCKVCGTCIQICPMEIFIKLEEKVVVDPKKETQCIGCKACEIQCTAEAIKVKE